MSHKTILILLIIYGLILCALVSQNGTLALMALPFVCYLGVGYLESPGEVRLRAARSVSRSHNTPGIPVEVRVTVVNEGPAVASLRISEAALPKTRVTEGCLEQRLALPAGETVELRYTFQAPRGCYAWQTVRVTAGDPFGLFEKSIDLPAPAEVLVLPRPPKLRRFPLQPRNTLHTAGPNRSRLPGSGIDFWGVREYRMGDSLRQIHWRMAARHPRMFFSKEFEREEIADIGLILDARPLADIRAGEESLFEPAVQAAAALSEMILKEGNRVSLLVLGENLVRLFPGSSKGQLIRILRALAKCAPGEHASFDQLKYLPVRLFPSHAFILVISPLGQRDFGAFTRLIAAGYQVLLISPNPVRFAAAGLQAGLAGSLAVSASQAVRAARLEREIQLWHLRQIGVEVVDWSVDQPLSKTVRATMWARRAGWRK